MLRRIADICVVKLRIEAHSSNDEACRLPVLPLGFVVVTCRLRRRLMQRLLHRLLKRDTAVGRFGQATGPKPMRRKRLRIQARHDRVAAFFVLDGPINGIAFTAWSPCNEAAQLLSRISHQHQQDS